MKQIIECPYCDGNANLHREVKEISYRKDVFNTMTHFYKCDRCNEEFTTTESDTISLIQVQNQYREKNHIPFTEEILTIREKYGLSASKMSLVLGLGTNGYSNYENGEIPTLAYGNLISAAADPKLFLDLLEKSRIEFTNNTFSKVKEKALQLMKTVKDNNLPNLNIYENPNNFTGFKKPNILKIKDLISYYIEKSESIFNDKLKINKMLFFTDFIHYKNFGESITGLSYRAIKYGPVPAYYDSIYTYLENEQIIVPSFLKLTNGAVSEVFVSNKTSDIQAFSKEEIETLNTVISKFALMPTWDMVELSHKEKAWKELEASKQLIGFQEYAFELAAI